MTKLPKPKHIILADNCFLIYYEMIMNKKLWEHSIDSLIPENKILGMVFDALNPLIVRLTGANINRRTMENIDVAGWKIEKSENLSSDIVRWIEARP